jgi:hypothetical protein
MRNRQSLPQLTVTSQGKDNAENHLMENKSACLIRPKFSAAISAEDMRSHLDLDPKIQKQRIHHQKRLESIFSENKGYFAHLMRSCLCGACTCGKCKCDHSRQLHIPMKISNKNSLYQDTFNWKTPYDFKRVKAPREGMPSVKGKPNDTTYFHDYNGFDPNHFTLRNNWIPDARNKDSEEGTKHIKAPFPLSISYKENYLNWETNKRPIVIGSPVDSTTDNRFPFFAHVTNREYGNFTPADVQKNFDSSKFGAQQFKNPIGPEIKLQIPTTHASTYQNPGSVEKTRKLKTQASVFGNGDPAYLNQFKTSYQNLNQLPPEICPARKIMIEMAQKSMSMTQGMNMANAKNLVC